MINNITNTSLSVPMASRNTSLTVEQKTLIEGTLSNYDSENLSESDALEIVNTFSKAGIQPGKELEETLKSSGFDAREIGQLANTSPLPPPSNQSTTNIDLSALVSYIEEHLSLTDDESLSSESLYKNLIDYFGLEEGQSIINISV